MSNWYATFSQLREAEISLHEWLEFHKERRAVLTVEERLKEKW